MIEAGVVITQRGAVHWHLPPGRTAGSIPDSQDLWDVFWDLRTEDGLGFAHSHPGSGLPGPSGTDVTTFSAVERGLGRRIQWWITSADQVILLNWKGPGPYDYESTPVEDPAWVEELRRLSR